MVAAPVVLAGECERGIGPLGASERSTGIDLAGRAAAHRGDRSQRERGLALIVTHRLLERPLGQGEGARGIARSEREAGGGDEPVGGIRHRADRGPGEVRGHDLRVGAAAGERRGRRGVEAATAQRPRLIADCGRQEGVGDARRILSGEEVGGGETLHGRLDPRRRQPDHLGHDPQRRRPQHRDGPGDGDGLLAESAQPHGHLSEHGVGHERVGILGRRQAVPLRKGMRELADEERVAAGGAHAGCDGAVAGAGQQAAQQRGGGGRRERLRPHDPQARCSEELREVVAFVGVGLAERHEQRHPATGVAGEVDHREERRLVAPLQIVDRQHERPVSCGVVTQEPEQTVGQGRRAVARSRQRARVGAEDVGDEPARRAPARRALRVTVAQVDDELPRHAQRHRAVQLARSDEQHPSARGPRRRGSRLQQPALPNARRADDRDGPIACQHVRHDREVAFTLEQIRHRRDGRRCLHSQGADS